MDGSKATSQIGENSLKSMKKKNQDDQNQNQTETISCIIPQSSILFLLYVNDLKNASNILDPIMFADDTNLFFTRKNVRYLF